ncbi:hypothetical protein D3C80_2177590 [compost metagenome]
MIETFGSEIKFGYYCEKNQAELIYGHIEEMFKLDDQEFIAMCVDAHKQVENFTWDGYVDKLLETIQL